MRLVAFALVCAAALPAQAQTPVFDRLTRAQGLPSDYVFGLDQDVRGFLWLATDAGIARYDGRTVRTWTTADGLPSNLAYAVRALPDGSVWAATYEGAARRTAGRFEVALANEAVNALHADGFGRVYLIGQRLHVWERGRVRRLTDRRLAPYVFALDPRRSAFTLTTQDGHWLDVLPQRDTVALRLRPQTVRQNAPQRLAYRLGMTGWSLAEADRIEIADARSGTLRAAVPGWKPLVAVPIGPDWLVSHSSGVVARWDGRALAPYLSKEALGAQSVHALLRDYEGGLWLGLFGGGAWRLSGSHLTLPGTAAPRLAEPLVWIGRDRAGLHIASRSHLYTLDEALLIRTARPVELIGRIAHARDGTVRYVSSTKLRGTDGRVRMYESNWFSSLRFDDGDTLWAGTYGSGLRRWVADRELARPTLPHGVRVVEDLAPGYAGALWALTRSHGALRYRRGLWTAFGRREGLPSDAVFSLYDAPDGTVWLGTDLGLVRHRRGTTRTFDAHGRLRGQRLHAVGAAGDTVWAIGDRTAYAAVGDSLHAFDASPLLPDPRWVVYDAEILPERRQAVLATSGGLVAVALPRFVSTLPPPRVALVQIDGTDIDRPSDTLRLAPGVRGVALTFAPLTFAAPDQARLQTRADGGPWTAPALDRTVSLAALTDGWHRLEVRAVNAAGVASDAPVRLWLYVPPPWWRTLWAQVAGLLLLVGLGAAGMLGATLLRRRRAERLRAQERRVQEERDRIARELHDHVGAQLSGVLAGLQLLDPGEPPPGDLVPALRDEVRHTIGALRTTLWTLRHPPTTVAQLGEHLSRYVRDQSRLYPHLALSAHAADLSEHPLPPLGALHVFRIGQEALRNALHHAHATHVRAALTFENNHLTLSIEDDGTFTAPSGMGHGLASMRSRAEEIGATFALDGTDAGTTVTLAWTPPRPPAESPERTMDDGAPLS